MASNDRQRVENKLKRELEQLEAAKKTTADKRRTRLVIIGAVVLVIILGGIGISKATSGSSSSTDTASSDTSSNSKPTDGEKPTVADCKQVKTISTKAKKYDPGYDQIQLSKDKKLGMFLKTNCGDIEIEFDVNAPTLTKNMIFLANTGSSVLRIPGDNKSGTKNVEGYFDNSPCHRLTTSGIFVLQCGDPTGTGTGGPGYTVIDENMDPRLKNGGDGQQWPRHQWQPVLHCLQGLPATAQLFGDRNRYQGDQHCG